MTQPADGRLIAPVRQPTCSCVLNTPRRQQNSFSFHDGGAMRVVQRTRIAFILPGLALWLLWASPAAAQSVAEARTWTITPFLGTSIGMDDPGPGNSLGIGVAVGYDLTPNIGFEGEVGHLFDIAGDSDSIDWSITNVSGNFIYHFDVRNITPYATFGLGFELSSINVDEDSLELLEDSSTEVSFNFGGGVKYPLSDTLLIRGDLRRFQSNDLAPDYWRVYAGLTFTFGR
jgi:OOP family OmpA-OmpF porin